MPLQPFLLPCIPFCPIILLPITSYFLVTSSASPSPDFLAFFLNDLSTALPSSPCHVPYLLPYLFPPLGLLHLVSLGTVMPCVLIYRPFPPRSLSAVPPYLFILVSSPPVWYLLPWGSVLHVSAGVFWQTGPWLVSDPAATPAEGCVSLTLDHVSPRKHSQGHANAKKTQSCKRTHASVCAHTLVHDPAHIYSHLHTSVSTRTCLKHSVWLCQALRELRLSCAECVNCWLSPVAIKAQLPDCTCCL